MVILLVVKRKVLDSLWDGSDVISVPKDICSAVSRIRVNFPGADASQHGDLFIWYGGCFWAGVVLRGELMRSHGNADLRETLCFSLWELLRLAHAASSKYG